MCAFVKHNCALDYRKQDGTTLRANLLSVAKVSGKTYDQLVDDQSNEQTDKSQRIPVSVKYPTQLDYLNEVFVALDLTREYNQGGFPLPILYRELKAYLDLNKLDLEQWEIEVILSLDITWLRQYGFEYNRDHPQSKFDT